MFATGIENSYPKIQLPDGTITEVQSRGLKRPPSFEMDEFEQRYWTTKPILTKEMIDNFVEVRDCHDNSLLASIAEYLEPTALGLERFVSLS